MKQPNISDINLSTSAVLCDVTFNQWGDTRKDKQAGEELAHMKNASADVVSLKVSLLGNCIHEAFEGISDDLGWDMYQPLWAHYYYGINKPLTKFALKQLRKLEGAEK